MSISIKPLGNRVVVEPIEQEEWDLEYQKRLFAWACDEIRGEFQENTWQAFWQTSVKGQAIWTAGAREFSTGENHDLVLGISGWLMGNSQDRAALHDLGKLP